MFAEIQAMVLKPFVGSAPINRDGHSQVIYGVTLGPDAKEIPIRRLQELNDKYNGELDICNCGSKIVVVRKIKVASGKGIAAEAKRLRREFENVLNLGTLIQ